MLTTENYFSSENNWKYCGSSQFKDFFGTLVKPGCEARAMAKLTGQWETQMSTALLVGSYVDSHFEGTLDLFKAQHPEILKRDGTLRAEYLQAEEIISFLEDDPYFMKFMGGEKQVIMTGEIAGHPFKIKIDSWIPETAIVDLKVMATLTKREYVRELRERVSFITYWGYDIQSAIYQEIVRQNTGISLPFYIAGASKEKVTNKEIIWIDDDTNYNALKFVETHTPRLIELKAGAVPTRCEKCDYCRATKMLRKPVHYLDIEDD